MCLVPAAADAALLSADVLADCRSADDCASNAYGEDELRRLSNSPEVLEAVSEDFGGDERVLQEAAGGSGTSFPLSYVSLVPSYVGSLPPISEVVPPSPPAPPPTYGCTLKLATNYDEAANLDDGSCDFQIIGCTDSTQAHYDERHEIDFDMLPSSSPYYQETGCVPIIIGCFLYATPGPLQDAWLAIEGNEVPTQFSAEGAKSKDCSLCPGGSCAAIAGCMDSTAINYRANAVIDNPEEPCTPKILGCNVPEAINYDSTSTFDDNSCEFPEAGCMESDAHNYEPRFTTPPTSDATQCIYLSAPGCINSAAINWINNGVNLDDGSTCILLPGIYGRLELEFVDGDYQYSGEAADQLEQVKFDAISCFAQACTIQSKVTPPLAPPPSPPELGSGDVTPSLPPPLPPSPPPAGVCAANSAFNGRNTQVTKAAFDQKCSDAGGPGNISSPYFKEYCKTPSDVNYYHVCAFETPGCDEAGATNYNSDATVSDGSCVYETPGCLDSMATNFCESCDVQQPGSCDYPKIGCTQALFVASEGEKVRGAGNTDLDATVQDWGGVDSDGNPTNDKCAYPGPKISPCNDPTAKNYDLGAWGAAVAFCDKMVSFVAANYSTAYPPCYTYDLNGQPCDYSALTWSEATPAVQAATTAYVNAFVADFQDFKAEMGRKCNGCAACLATDDCAAESDCSQFRDVICDDYTLKDGSVMHTCPVTTATCVHDVEGCTKTPGYLNYNPNATVDSFDACIKVEQGCMDSLATNFDPTANVGCGDSRGDADLGELKLCPCQYIGCMNTNAKNYDSLATQPNPLSCVLPVTGCTSSTADNYDSDAEVDDGTCEYPIYGCTDPTAMNYNANATKDPGDKMPSLRCVYEVRSCCDPYADNYNASTCGNDTATQVFVSDPTLCAISGCMDSTALNFYPNATESSDICVYPLEGCLSEWADNFNFQATVLGTCTKAGCNDPSAINYDAKVTDLDDSCKIVDCTVAFAQNSPQAAQMLQEGCTNVTYRTAGCTNSSYSTYNSAADFSVPSMCETYPPTPPPPSPPPPSPSPPSPSPPPPTPPPPSPPPPSSPPTPESPPSPPPPTPPPPSPPPPSSPPPTPPPPLMPPDPGAPPSPSAPPSPDSPPPTLPPPLPPLPPPPSPAPPCIPIGTWPCTNELDPWMNKSATFGRYPCPNGDCTCDTVITYSGYPDVGAPYAGYKSADMEVKPNTFWNTAKSQLGSWFRCDYAFNAPISTFGWWAYFFQFLAQSRCKCKFNPEWVANKYCRASCYHYDKAYADHPSDSAGACCAPPTPAPPPPPAPHTPPPPRPPPPSPSPTPPPPPVPPLPPPTPLAPPPESGSGDVGSGDVGSIGSNAARRLAQAPGALDAAGRRLQATGCMDPVATTYDATAVDHDGSFCSYALSGCTDPLAANYLDAATVDDGSCVIASLGCISPDAANYDSTAGINDGSCVVAVPGCMDPYAANYLVTATSQPDGACVYLVSGCTIEQGTLNYDSLATRMAGCVFAVPGCMDSLAANYLSTANTDESDSCRYEVLGCTTPSALNYDTLATIDDGLQCVNPSAENGYKGCTDSRYLAYDSRATIAGDCEGDLIVEGCIDPLASNYNASNNVADGSCTYPVSTGCTDPADAYYNSEVAAENSDPTACSGLISGCTDKDSICYQSDATYEDGSCWVAGCEGILGCMDTSALTYRSYATKHRASDCVYPPVYGCSDPVASNYDPDANGCSGDGNCCEGYAKGCTDSLYDNYNDLADSDDGSCYKRGCTVSIAFNFDPLATTPTGTSAYTVCLMPLLGCTSSESPNYNSDAQADDGSCTFEGCLNSLAPNYDPTANAPVSGKVCVEDSNLPGYGDECGPVPLGGCDNIVEGCLHSNAQNYNSLANYDPLPNDGSCLLLGCMNEGAANYAPWATAEYYPSNCDLAYSGCMDPAALNYWSEAQYDLGSCLYSGCADSTYYNYDPTVGVNEAVQCLRRLEGCMDPAAWYNWGGPSVTVDDGSCIYAGCMVPDRVKYDPLATLQLYTENYDDPLYEYCGGLALPPPPPVDFDLSRTVVLQAGLDVEDCGVVQSLLSVDSYSDVLIALAAGTLTITAPLGVDLSRLRLEIESCAERRRRELEHVDDVDVILEVDMLAPDDKEPEELVADLSTFSVEEWSDALGVPVAFILICIYDAQGTLRCNLPPPVPPPAGPPPPPAPLSPPPASPDDGGVPVMIIIIVVLSVLVVALAVFAGIAIQRRKKRIEASSVSPNVDNRVTVQPPPLPAGAGGQAGQSDPYRDRLPAQPPSSVTQYGSSSTYAE